MPDTHDAVLRQPAVFGHYSRAPVCPLRRHLLQRLGYYLLDLPIADLARGAHPRFIQQTFYPVFQEALPPFPYRRRGDPQIICDFRITLPLGTPQNDAGTQRHRLC